MTRDELLKKICPWGTCDCGDDYESCNCDDCNRVLEKWLDEYDKQIRAKAINDYDNKLNEKINTDTRLKDTIRKILDNVAKEMYCKGVEHFAFLMKEALNYDWATTKISEQIIYNRLYDECDRIAEQLKAGGENE